MTEDFKKKLPYLVDRVVELKENSQRYCEIIQRLKSLIKEEKKQGNIVIRMDDLEKILFELCEPEDEKTRRGILEHIKMCTESIPDRDKYISWLEKQKGVSKREYVFRPIAGSDISDAAKKAVEKQKSGENIVLAFNGVYITVDDKSPDEIVDEYYDGIDIIEHQMREELEKIEPKSAWSEEDNYNIEKLFCILNNEQDNYPQLSCDFQEIKDIKNWLNSFKERYTWKPSEEQLNALDEVYKTHGANNVCRKVILNLLEQLKKL